MVSGGSNSSSGQGGTGNTTSLSFVPALLSNAFFGSGIGLQDGGFMTTGMGNFTPGGKMKGPQSSSLIDPFGLGNVVGSNPLLGQNNPFYNFNQGGGQGGGQGGLSQFAAPGGSSGDFLEGNTGQTLMKMFGGGNNKAFTSMAELFGFMGDKPVSPEDQARQQVAGMFKQSPASLGLGNGGVLNPFDLISNITDLANPGSNPGIGSALQGLQTSQLGSLFGNDLLFGDISSTLKEGLNTGFKPDLQPVINEASRSFFNEIVPQLGQSNVAMQEGVGPFSTDLTGQLSGAGATLASQLGAMEVQNQNQAADRKGEMLGLSSLITDQLFNAGTNAGRNALDLGEQLAQQGTVGGRQSTLLQLLAGINPGGPIQSSQNSSQSKGAQGGIL